MNTQINIRIRSMHGNYSTTGIFLESSNPLVPKLRPGEVVAVVSNHPVLDSYHIEITREEPNRPYEFDTVYEANEQHMSAAEAINAAKTVESSKERSAKIRAENKAAVERAAIESGDVPDMGVTTIDLNDADLADPVADNSVLRKPSAPRKPRGRMKRGGQNT